MSAFSQARTAARVAVVMGLVGFFGVGSAAQSAPPLPSDLQLSLRTVPPNDSERDTQVAAQPAVQFAALAPVETSSLTTPAMPERGPFGMIAVHDGAMAAKWRGLQPAIKLEARILDFCRVEGSICPPAAARFLAVVHAARGLEGRARIGAINQAINLAIRPMSDWAQYQVADVWTTPLTTFASGAGDCEDYAIAKYVALREAGLSPDDLRIVILHNAALKEDHAVTAARVDGEWLILDNRQMIMRTDSQIGDMTPLLTLEHEDGHRKSAVASAS